MRKVNSCTVLLFWAAWVPIGCGGTESKPASAAWTDKTFLLDVPAISGSSWVKPSGALAGTIGNFGVPQLLFGVEVGSGADLAVTMSSAQDGIQDPCIQTTQTRMSGNDYPKSAIEAAAFPIRIVGKDPTNPSHVVATLHDAAFRDLLPGLGNVETSEFSFTIDVAEVATFLYPGGSSNSICQIAAASGSPCEICPFNEAPDCLAVQAVRVSAIESPVSIKKVSLGDVPGSCYSDP